MQIEHYMANEKKDDQKEYIVHAMGFKQPDEFEWQIADSSG